MMLEQLLGMTFYSHSSEVEGETLTLQLVRGNLIGWQFVSVMRNDAKNTNLHDIPLTTQGSSASSTGSDHYSSPEDMPVGKRRRLKSGKLWPLRLIFHLRN